jgi:hypothetical protein
MYFFKNVIRLKVKAYRDSDQINFAISHAWEPASSAGASSAGAASAGVASAGAASTGAAPAASLSAIAASDSVA